MRFSTPEWTGRSAFKAMPNVSEAQAGRIGGYNLNQENYCTD
jgi:hypothetical protein